MRKNLLAQIQPKDGKESMEHILNSGRIAKWSYLILADFWISQSRQTTQMDLNGIN